MFSGAILSILTTESENFGKQRADSEQRERSEPLLSSVERGVYNTADPSLDVGYEVDLAEAGFDGYKQELEMLLKEAGTSERQGKNSGVLGLDWPPSNHSAARGPRNPST
jgi:hypothetical protein